MPFEEKEEIRKTFADYDVTLISMIAPTSDDRVKKIAEEADGFVYCVSSLGVTGVRARLNTGISRLIGKVKEVKEIPCAIGFGISTPEQAKEMAAIVRLVAEHGEDCVPYVREYVKSMKQAVQSVL